MDFDNHGSCKNCGYDLNGEKVYDYFLREYRGDKKKAAEVAEMFGAKEGYGRFGKEIMVMSYENYNPKSICFICPECREECY